MEDHPLFQAFDEKHNKYIGMKKNTLLKLCKDNKIDAERSDNDEDLAFLLYRLDENKKMNAEEILAALDELGINPGQNKEHNLLLMITYELALVDLLEAEEEELLELCNEYVIQDEGKDREELIVEISVAIVNQ